MFRSITALAAAAVLVASSPVPAAAQKVLRVVPHSDLKIIDPIWTTALITANHAYLVYDQLFAFDEKLEIKPQMVDTYEVSADTLTWTFKLRDGLAWHDGQPVTAEDCVASLRRWAARDGMGQKLMSFTAALEAVDAKTIRLRLKEPYGLVLPSLARVTALGAFMMPKRVAETDPNTQISDPTGSGPFIFKRDEWKPGEKVVYVKNAAYKPRAEAPSGLAGGKVAKVDRIEWVIITDAQIAIDALRKGDVDYIEAPPHDLLPQVANDASVKLLSVKAAGRFYIFRFNQLHKPFDDARVRRAVTYAFNQEDFLAGMIGDAKWYSACKSVYSCGSPLESVTGWADRLGSDFAKSKALLAEAGYDGTPIVLLHSTDVPLLRNLAPIAKSLLEKGGFKVEMMSMDWQSVVARRARKEAPAAGGWHAFMTAWGTIDALDPASFVLVNAACDKAMFGWPCDAEIERLRDAFAREPDAAKRKAIAEAVQLRLAESPTYVQLGQFTQPVMFRAEVSGVLSAPLAVFWNIEKK